MELKNGENSYGVISRANHWISAALFIGLVILGIYMHELDKGPEKTELYALHKSLGIGLFMLMILRLVWLKVSPNPEQLSKTKFEHILGHAVKGILYLAMLILPISGWVMSNSGGHPVAFFDLFTLPTIVGENHDIHEIAEEVHEIGKWMLLIILLHVAGALKHHIVYKDSTLLRMLGRK
ncbi:cytochrome b [Thiomicrorhabdus sp.]|uniref:cytochrome b n=1 Tax=Thiomicrorhabdus sp. TaxID=2039724 RepID=UPI0029C638A3|nr:cytochrome b [Thiomicrorhabdus sp.]